MKVVHDPLLDGLRGVAALMVACSHSLCLGFLSPAYRPPAVLCTLEGGHCGVLLFFVLSGYVVSWTNQKPFTAAAVADFARRRLVRLGPVYYAAVALTVAVVWATGRVELPTSYLAGALWLQNFNPYFGLPLPPLETNSPLWSLNYEVIYYATFVLLWRFQPKGSWVFGPAIVAGILGWFCPRAMPLFLSSYACGWVFWAGGWWLAGQPPASATECVRWPIASGLLLVFACQRIDGLTRIFNALGWYSRDSGMVGLSDLGRLPAILLVLAAITGRRLPGWKLWLASAWLVLLVPLAGMAWTGRLLTNVSWLTGFAATVLAGITAGWPGRGWLRLLAPFGGISYGFYVVHFPLLFVVGASALPDASLAGFFLRLLTWGALSVGLAWVLERKMQPWLKRRLLPAHRLAA